MNEKRTSKFLSLVLRHKPEVIGLKLDKQGWANIDDLLDKIKTKGYSLNVDQLKSIVDNNNKKRFKLSEDLKKIKANQGHSIKVDLELKKQVPPFELYHGTAEKNLDSIKGSGLDKRNRHHVHLSENKETAIDVGNRYGKPVVLIIKARAMHTNGFSFYKSDNNVWLVDNVPIEYISFPK